MGYLRDRQRGRKVIWKEKEARFREIKGDKARDYKRFILLDGTPRHANGATRPCLRCFQCGKHNYRVTPSSAGAFLPPRARRSSARRVKAVDKGESLRCWPPASVTAYPASARKKCEDEGENKWISFGNSFLFYCGRRYGTTMCDMVLFLRHSRHSRRGQNSEVKQFSFRAELVQWFTNALTMSLLFFSSCKDACNVCAIYVYSSGWHLPATKTSNRFHRVTSATKDVSRNMTRITLCHEHGGA